jgi:RNA polymerase sigma-70 factor (ECF subfamily)
LEGAHITSFPAQAKESDSVQHTKASVEPNEHLEILCRDGATQALEQILSGRLPLFYIKAYRLLGNRADAEDAVQDALLAAYTHLDQFKGQSQMSSWVTAIVLNSARMRLRTRLRHIHVPLDEPIGGVKILSLSERLADGRPNPEDEYRNAELRTRLTCFHSRLSPTLRRTFQLRAIAGLSVRKTAQILGVPNGTVKAQFARARKKLKELMSRSAKPRTRSRTGNGYNRSTAIPENRTSQKINQCGSALQTSR